MFKKKKMLILYLETEHNGTFTSKMIFTNGSEYELLTNFTVNEGENDEWIDLNSAASCLGGWFKLPSGKEL